MGHKPWDRPWRRIAKMRERRRWRSEAERAASAYLAALDEPVEISADDIELLESARARGEVERHPVYVFDQGWRYHYAGYDPACRRCVTDVTTT